MLSGWFHDGSLGYTWALYVKAQAEPAKAA
jgi:hypothetical protein